MNFIYLCISVVLLISCENTAQEKSNDSLVQKSNPPVEVKEIILPEGKNIEERFAVPEGYVRMKADSGSFAWYLRHLPLKEAGQPVYHFDGSLKRNQRVHAAVFDVDTGDRDLQQCADAVMRLRAEYLWSSSSYKDITFSFNNGFKADFSKWRAGNRIKVAGNQVNWYAIGRKQHTYKDFRRYMNMVFAYAGTYSLAKDLKKVDVDDMQIGDVFVQGGSPGHAIIVVDMAEHQESGKKVFMLAQSYMPAQDIHILKNWEDKRISPWYELPEMELNTPEWNFSVNDLKRF